MGGFDSPFSLLLCKEDESCLIEREEIDVKFDWRPISESEIEYINFLIKKEVSYIQSDISVKSYFIEDCFANNQSDLIDSSSQDTQNWVKLARMDAIKWILKARSVFGFQFRTAYLALMYLDHFLSRQTFDKEQEWVIKLGSVACFSLAAKMEEQNVPALSRYQMDGCNFDEKVVKRMELMVLTTLNWKMGLTTPFAYLHYFIFKFCGESKPDEIYARAIGFILDIVEEINLVNVRPSFVAASVVLAAYDDDLTREELESKISVISSWDCPDREQIQSCYQLLQEVEMKKGNTPIPRNFMQNRSASSDVSSIKRKLTFNECDENCPIQKIRRQLK